MKGPFQREKIEEVGVFQKLGSEIRLGRGQGALEVGGGLALAFMDAAFKRPDRYYHAWG